MKKYSVRLVWDKYIEFPVITARDKKEAEEKAEEILNTDRSLVECEGTTKWKIEEIK